MTQLHKNLIDGEWVGSDGVENINPSNINEVVGVYARATSDVLDGLIFSTPSEPTHSPLMRFLCSSAILDCLSDRD